MEVTFLVTPYFSSLYIDNQKLAENDPATAFGQHFTHRLPPGRHKVTLESACCLTDEFVIQVPEPGTGWAPAVFRRRLQFLPARLRLESRVSPVEVWVDGKFMGTCEESARLLELPIPISNPSGKQEFRILLMHPRLGEARLTIQVSGGEKTRATVRAADFR